MTDTLRTEQQRPSAETAFEPTLGAEHVLEEGAFDDGVLVGPWRERWPSGEMKEEGSYDRGKKDGPWREHWPSGALKNEGAYKKGKKDGPWRHLAADGKLLAQGTYKNDQRHGAWIDPTGTSTWKQGVQVRDPR